MNIDHFEVSFECNGDSIVKKSAQKSESNNARVRCEYVCVRPTLKLSELIYWWVKHTWNISQLSHGKSPYWCYFDCQLSHDTLLNGSEPTYTRIDPCNKKNKNRIKKSINVLPIIISMVGRSDFLWLFNIYIYNTYMRVCMFLRLSKQSNHLIKHASIYVYIWL